MKAARNCLGLGLFAILGAAAGFVITACGFVALWWGFPGEWEPLGGVPDTPRQVLAYKLPEEEFLLRTAGGQLLDCQAGTCAPADADWSTPETRCGAGDSPASLALFPFVLGRAFRVVLACEQDYLSTVRSVFVVQDRAEFWHITGAGMIPTDAAVIGMGLIGSVAGFVGAIVLALIAFVISRNRPKTAPMAGGPSAAG